MPIPISDYATPKFTRYRERYPMSYDKQDRFNEVCPRDNPKRYMGSEGRYGGWKLPGYNPNHNSTSIERINLTSDSITLRPY